MGSHQDNHQSTLLIVSIKQRLARVACGGFLERQELLLEPTRYGTDTSVYPVAHSDGQTVMTTLSQGGGWPELREGSPFLLCTTQNILLSIGPPGRLEQSLDVAVDPTVLSPRVFGLGTHGGGGCTEVNFSGTSGIDRNAPSRSWKSVVVSSPTGVLSVPQAQFSSAHWTLFP